MFKSLLNYNHLTRSEKYTVDKLDKKFNDYMDLIAKTPIDELPHYSKQFQDFLVTGRMKIEAIEYNNPFSKRPNGNITPNDNNGNGSGNDGSNGTERTWSSRNPMPTTKAKHVHKATFGQRRMLDDQQVLNYLIHKHGQDLD